MSTEEQSSIAARERAKRLRAASNSIVRLYNDRLGRGPTTAAGSADTAASPERDLDTALGAQARDTTRYRHSVGTTSELSAYASLRAASRTVRKCDLANREAQSGLARSTFTVPSDATGPGEARREVADLIRDRVLPATAETVELLASETVTNAVIHGAQPQAPINLDALLTADRFRLEVTNLGAPFENDAELSPATALGGRGLFLIDTLALGWGQLRTEQTVVVWFEVPRPTDLPSDFAACRLS